MEILVAGCTALHCHSRLQIRAAYRRLLEVADKITRLFGLNCCAPPGTPSPPACRFLLLAAAEGSWRERLAAAWAQNDSFKTRWFCFHSSLRCRLKVERVRFARSSPDFSLRDNGFIKQAAACVQTFSPGGRSQNTAGNEKAVDKPWEASCCGTLGLALMCRLVVQPSWTQTSPGLILSPLSLLLPSPVTRHPHHPQPRSYLPPREMFVLLLCACVNKGPCENSADWCRWPLRPRRHSRWRENRRRLAVQLHGAPTPHRPPPKAPPGTVDWSEQLSGDCFTFPL